MRAIEKLKRPVILKPQKFTKATPCAAELTKLFNCWRDSKIDSQACAAFSLELTACMATKKEVNAGSERWTSQELNKWYRYLRDIRIRKSWMGKRL
jgi:hypothetical protein